MDPSWDIPAVFIWAEGDTPGFGRCAFQGLASAHQQNGDLSSQNGAKSPRTLGNAWKFISHSYIYIYTYIHIIYIVEGNVADAIKHAIPKLHTLSFPPPGSRPIRKGDELLEKMRASKSRRLARSTSGSWENE